MIARVPGIGMRNAKRLVELRRSRRVWPLAMQDSDIELHSVQIVPATSNLPHFDDLA